LKFISEENQKLDDSQENMWSLVEMICEEVMFLQKVYVHEAHHTLMMMTYPSQGEKQECRTKVS
jgi:hypothetical protein